MSEVLDQILQSMRLLSTAPRQMVVAIWSAMPPSHGWRIQDGETDVQFISPAAWRRIEAELEHRPPSLVDRYAPTLMGVPVVDMDAGGPEADRLRALLIDKLQKQAGPLPPADPHYPPFTMMPR